ncbi:amidase family protein [Bradyrhizobium sp. 197]|uniref:amidase family protein n=1 Tax=Bradyrhizobium sp. 197 TaxID=2782663 RepID=UPI001FF96913|nr:amidase family protein [Bradyrhizobium sp. 197]
MLVQKGQVLKPRWAPPLSSPCASRSGKTLGDFPSDHICLEAQEKTATLCETLGHEVVSIEPPDFEYSNFIDAIVTVMAANITLTARTRLASEQRDPTADELEPAILDGYHLGTRLSAPDYAVAINRLHATGRMMAQMMEGYDLLLTPTLVSLPMELGTIAMETADFIDYRRRVGKLTPFLAVVNASGQPAASLPLWRHAGLPVGVQLIGHFGREDIVLRLASQLETSELWRAAQQWPDATAI